MDAVVGDGYSVRLNWGGWDPNHLLFAIPSLYAGQATTLQQSVQEMEILEYTAAHLHRQPDYIVPAALLQNVKALMDSGKYHVFE